MSQNKWLTVLRCPKCKGELTQVQHNNAKGLLCPIDNLVFPIRDGMPIMLIEQAQPYVRESENYDGLANVLK